MPGQVVELLSPAASDSASRGVELERGRGLRLVRADAPHSRSDIEPTDSDGLLAARRWQRVVKRTLDVVLCLAALVVFAPLLVIVAIAIVASSRGGPLFAQDRVGKDGRVFRLLKFRSMYRDADTCRPSLETQNEADGPIFKMRSDPRVTAVGRVIRKYSIDELPQLFNVLKGEMTLVGPRPPLPEEVVAYGTVARHRLRVVPGLTCFWQVRGRSNLGFSDLVALDLEYIRTWSLRLDLLLILQTVPAVLAARGAY